MGTLRFIWIKGEKNLIRLLTSHRKLSVVHASIFYTLASLLQFHELQNRLSSSCFKLMFHAVSIYEHDFYVNLNYRRWRKELTRPTDYPHELSCMHAWMHDQTHVGLMIVRKNQCLPYVQVINSQFSKCSVYVIKRGKKTTQNYGTI